MSSHQPIPFHSLSLFLQIKFDRKKQRSSETESPRVPVFFRKPSALLHAHNTETEELRGHIEKIKSRCERVNLFCPHLKKCKIWCVIYSDPRTFQILLNSCSLQALKSPSRFKKSPFTIFCRGNFNESINQFLSGLRPFSNALKKLPLPKQHEDYSIYMSNLIWRKREREWNGMG